MTTEVNEPVRKKGTATRWFDSEEALDAFCVQRNFGKPRFIEHIGKLDRKDLKAYSKELWSDAKQYYKTAYLLVMSLNEYDVPSIEVIPNLHELKYEDIRFTGSVTY